MGEGGIIAFLHCQELDNTEGASMLKSARGKGARGGNLDEKTIQKGSCKGTDLVRLMAMKTNKKTTVKLQGRKEGAKGGPRGASKHNGTRVFYPYANDQTDFFARQ